MRGPSRFHVTSTTGDYGRVYPMETWQDIEDKLALVSSQNRAKRKFLLRTTYYGTPSSPVNNGVQLSGTLLESAKIKGEAIVLGADDHLRVFSLEHLNEMVQRGKLEPTEVESIAGLDSAKIENHSVLAAIDLSRRQELLDLLTKCRKSLRFT